MICKSCGAEVKDGVKFCPSCGNKIELPSPDNQQPTKNDAGGSVCASCGASLKPGAKFCPSCGSKVGETAEKVPEAKPEVKAEQPAVPVPEKKSDAAAAETVTCSCGNVLKPGAKFCPKCGNKVGEKAEEAKKPDEEKANVCSCGNVLKPGAKFCPKCGKKIGEAPSDAPSAIPVPAASAVPTPAPTQSVPITPAGVAAVPAAPVAAKKPLDKKTKIIIAAAAGVVVLAIIIIVIVANITPKIKLSDYVEVEFSGYSGYGELKYSFDSDKFREDWKDKLKYNGNISSEIPSYYFDFASDPAEIILSSVKYDMSFNKTSELKNGDVVKMKWNLESTKKYLEQAIKVELDISEAEFTVADLETVGTFDPFTGFEISYTGYDGNGRPTIGNSQYQLEYTFDKTEGLKNGDTVHVTVSAPYGDSLAKYCVDNIGSVPSSTGKDFKVSGLSGMETFDPFENISIEFEGFSPNGKAKIKKGSSDYYLNYELDKSEGLKNGDKITVTVKAPYGEDLEKYCKDEYEKKPAQSKKEFTVSTLPEYITKISDIPEAELTKMKNEGEDLIKSEITGDNESLSKLDYQGMLLLNLKEGKPEKSSYSSDGNHMFYLVYLVTVKVKDYDKNTVTYSYWTYTRFKDIAKNSDGTYTVDINDIKRPYDSVSPEKVSEYYKGYKDYEDLYAKVVTAQLSDYKHEADFSASQKQESSQQSSQASKQSSESSKNESSAESSNAGSAEESSKQTSQTSSQASSQESSKEEASAEESSKKAAA